MNLRKVGKYAIITTKEIKSGEGVHVTERSRKKNQWISENLDRINLTVVKGKKEIIRAHAEERGESVNAFINRAIESTLEQDNQSTHA